MNTSSSLSNKKIIEEFIKKATLVILNSRIQIDKDDDKTAKVNSSFLLDQRDNDDLDDIFLEDYSELQSYQKLLNNYTIEIFFKRKEFSVLMEKWSFQYLQGLEDWDLNTFIDNDYNKRKLAIMVRSVYSMSRFLPAYSLFNKNGFNYCFEYRLFLSPKNQKKFPNVPTSKVKISNCEISNISIDVEYINKSDVFQLEEEYHRKTLEYLISNRTKQRPRCFSLTNPSNNPLFEVLTFDSSEKIINEEYFSDKRKAKNKLDMSNEPSQIKYVNDVSFQSETDNPLYHHYISTEPPPSDIEANLSNDLCLKKCTLFSDSIEQSFHRKQTSIEDDCNHYLTYSNTNNHNDSTAKKLMKTSDTSSELKSENSFELEIEDDYIEDKTQKNLINNNHLDDKILINANNIITEKVLCRYSNLKRLLKTKTRLNTYKLSRILPTVLETKY